VGTQLDLSAAPGALLALATVALGLSTVLWLPPVVAVGERVVVGMVSAIVAVTLTGYLVALVIGVHLTLVVVLAGLALAAAALLAGMPHGRRELDRLRHPIDRVITPTGVRLGASVVVLGLVLAFLFARAIVVTPDGFIAHYGNVWSDWSFHASYTTTFAFGQNLPPQNPLFALTPFRYPFAPDFASALLVAGGWSVPAALIWPGWAMAALALSGLILWARRLTGTLAAGGLAVTLTLLGGGLGFWYFFQDAARRGLLPTLADIPRTYDRFDPPINIQWYNPILTYYLPQRSFVFGAAILMSVLLLLTPALQGTAWGRWRDAIRALRAWGGRRGGDGLAFLWAGSLAGTLPWFHLHSLVVIGIVTLIWAVLLPRPAWLLFLVPVLILAVPRLLLAVPGDATAPAGLHYPRIELGWVAGADNPVWFWLKNTGAFWPLLLLALLSPLALSTRSRVLLAPFCAVFLIANIAIFQPWDWDNTKLLVFWYLAGGVAVGALLTRLWRAGVAGKTASVGLWLTLVASGALSLVRDLPPQGPAYVWFTPEEVQLAAQVRERTDPHAIFVTGDRPNNPVADLAGRSVLMSYRGWLWTYGIDYAARERDIARIYAGDAQTLSLLHRYGAGYVVIGPDELATWHANLTYFQANYRLFLKTASYQIYAVP
jgi:hypothetical protein